MSDDVVSTITHPWLAGVTAETTRTDNKNNRVDVGILDDVVALDPVTTLTGAAKYAGLTASAVEFVSGNDEDPAIFAVAIDGDDVDITIADETNIAIDDFDLVVRLTFGFGYIDKYVRVSVTAA